MLLVNNIWYVKILQIMFLWSFDNVYSHLAVTLPRVLSFIIVYISRNQRKSSRVKMESHLHHKYVNRKTEEKKTSDWCQLQFSSLISLPTEKSVHFYNIKILKILMFLALCICGYIVYFTQLYLWAKTQWIEGTSMPPFPGNPPVWAPLWVEMSGLGTLRTSQHWGNLSRSLELF